MHDLFYFKSQHSGESLLEKCGESPQRGCPPSGDSPLFVFTSSEQTLKERQVTGSFCSHIYFVLLFYELADVGESNGRRKMTLMFARMRMRFEMFTLYIFILYMIQNGYICYVVVKSVQVSTFQKKKKKKNQFRCHTHCLVQQVLECFNFTFFNDNWRMLIQRIFNLNFIPYL